MKPSNKKIPVRFHILYLLLAAVIAYLYYLKIVEPFNSSAPNSIDSVTSLQTGKPYQFRLLIPAIFVLFRPLAFIPQKVLYLFYSILVMYLIITVYYKLLAEYFQDTDALMLYSSAILYPILWNYVLINGIFQYYDFTAILLFCFGLYLIVKEKYFALLALLFLATVNKETAGYLIPAYLLFNYKTLLTKRIVLRISLLIIVYVAVKVSLSYIFRNNPGANVEICTYENVNALKNLFTSRVYLKHIVFNFGALYIFVILLFLSGRWKMFPHRNLLFINLAFFPNIFLGYFVTYFDEVRVYAEFIPLITTMSFIYLSTFRINGLKLKGKS